MVGRGGVEPPFSVFQTGTPTAYVIFPYKPDCEGIEPPLDAV